MLIAIVVASMLPAPAESLPPPFHPSRLAHVGDSRQLVVVTASSWSTSRATLRAYRQDKHGHWRPAVRALARPAGVRRPGASL